LWTRRGPTALTRRSGASFARGARFALARQLRIRKLELRERVSDRADLLGVLFLDQRQQRPHALDRESCLLEVAHVLAARRKPEALSAQVHEADDGLEQDVTDGDAPQLLLELCPQLLLGRVLVAMFVAVLVLVRHRVAWPQGAAMVAPAEA
jgi:hypothetical protein